MTIKTYLILLILSFFCAVNAQDKKDIKTLTASAETKFKVENYEDALEDYLQITTLDSKNETVNYNTAICYLNTNINKAKAVPYLEIVTRNEKHNPNADYLLGRAYQYSNRFDDAIASFEKFKKNAKGNEDNLKEVEQQIQHCINAKELIKYPLDVQFHNLGKNINSAFADYYPFVTENESYIIYNSRRPTDKEAAKLENGQYLNNIQVSKVVNGTYMESTVVEEPISKGNSGNEIIGMNSRGNIILINKHNIRGESKLYQSEIIANGDFTKPVELPPVINGSGDVIAATINSEGSEIYFASNRKGGYGGTDLYVCNKLPNGKWSEAQNLGKEINTIYDEDFPNLSPDGKNLYFSSKGHSSMGGYDIFRATFNNEFQVFGNVQNIGYPLNTSFDDLNFRISKNGRYGYVASLRGGGLGDYDIYRVSFNDVEVDYTVLIWQINSKDSTLKVDYKNSFVAVNDNITNEIVGTYVPNPNSGKLIIILPPGKYTVTVESPGFKDYIYPIEVYDKASYQSEINLNISLTKKL
ncbi:MAG: PD40 domain-containing protein [Bacteroidetes bacterium]|nr:PD40 domain-containing protein [Bacteroidota bacterium]